MNTRTLDVDIQGMTCASCVATVEKRLNDIDGVEASVNLATERARVVLPEGVSDQQVLAAVTDAGYQASIRGSGHEHGHDAAPGSVSLGARLMVSASLSIPVVLLSMIPAWQFEYWQYVVFLLATPVVVWGGIPFHRAAWASLRHGQATMDTLVSIGTLVAYFWSVWALAFGQAGMVGMTHTLTLRPTEASEASANIYFETATVLITFILLGRWLEERSRRRAGAALSELSRLLPSEVRVVEQSPTDPRNLLAPTRRESMRSLALVTPGMVIAVLPGERVAVDGTVIAGRAHVDESAVTGESMPRSVEADSALSAGALVLDGRLEIKVHAVGADTRIAQLTELVDAAQVAKSRAQKLADRISSVFVPAVIVLAVLSTLAWGVFTSNWAVALSVGIAVIIIACPCALGLATPVAIMAGTGRGAQLGLIISGPDALENARKIDTVFIDKTGTLTTGELSLEHITTVGSWSEDDALRTIASVEQGSEHPIARALVRAAAQRGLPLVTVSSSVVEVGVGISAHFGGATWRVRRVRETDPLTPELRNVLDRSSGSAAVLEKDGAVVAVVTIRDELKADAREAVAELVSGGMEPRILSGDRAEAVAHVAREVGVVRFESAVTPERKREFVVEERRRGPVAMVGDGINDAAALAEAQLGIAMGSGTDLARAASDITILRSDARAIPQAIRLARRVDGTIRGNLAWAFGYNIAAIPLAMAGLLNPMIAGAAMAFSSLFVVLNSVRLTRFR